MADAEGAREITYAGARGYAVRVANHGDVVRMEMVDPDGAVVRVDDVQHGPAGRPKAHRLMNEYCDEMERLAAERYGPPPGEKEDDRG